MKIPDYRTASDRRAHGMDSCLDHFITEFQPVPPEAEDFREALQNVIDEVEWRMAMEERRRTAERRFNAVIALMISVAVALMFTHYLHQLITTFKNTGKEGAQSSDVQIKASEAH